MKTMFIIAAVTFLMAAFVVALTTSRKDSWRCVITAWSLLAIGVTFTMLTIYS